MLRSVGDGFFASLFLVAAVSAQPISLSRENPHYFLHNGKTVVLIGSGEHYGAVLNRDFDFQRYLETIASEGLNYTRLFTGSYVEVPGKSFGILRNSLAPAPRSLLTPWKRSGDRFDLTQWDPVYFDRLHAFLGEAEKLGVIVEVTLFSALYGEPQWTVCPFHPDNNVNGLPAIDWRKFTTLGNARIVELQQSYTQKMVQEVNSFDNVILEIQNEPWSDRPVLSGTMNPYLPLPGRNQYPNSIDLPDESSIAWQTQVALWITNEEQKLPKRHLIAQNYCNFRYPVRALIPGVSVVNFHYAYPEAASLNYGLNLPIAYDETGFLGQGDAAYLRQAWNFLLSGGGTFNNLDYSFSVGHEDGSDREPNGPGGGSKNLRSELAFLRRFLEALPLSKMHPDNRVVAQSGGAISRALADGAAHYVIYLDGTANDASVELNLPQGTFEYEWIDPASGKTSSADRLESGRKLIVPQSPGLPNGLVLHLTKAHAQ